MNLFPALLALVLSDVAGGVFSFGYKAIVRLKQRTGPFILLYGLTYTIFSAVGILLIGGVSADPHAWIFGVLHGVIMCMAILFYIRIIGKIRLSISWTIIQFSIFIPLVTSLLFFENHLSLLSVGGTLLMLIAIIIFSLGKKDRSAQSEDASATLATWFLLFFSSLFSGLAFTIPMLYMKTAGTSQPLHLLFASGVGTLLCSLFFIRKEDWKEIKGDWKVVGVPSVMSFLQIISWAFLMVGLQGIDGAVAYSLKGFIGLLCVYTISFTFFKETVARIEKIGLLVSVGAILLMTVSLYTSGA
ncbi:MAG: hypothetical protein GX911_01050 [Spirochaetales bacterium]|nr:hypothetical protein [Spirochaetales bacterium]